MAGSGTAHLREHDAEPVLAVEHLVVEFPVRQGRVHAVSDVSFDLSRGETLGIVGESGCGKSTVGRSIMRIPPPTSGTVRVHGREFAELDAERRRDVTRRVQMVFQDASAALNPRRTVLQIVAEPLVIDWLESFPRSPIVRAWERFVPKMLAVWRHRAVRRVAIALLTVFLAGLVVWIAGDATGAEQADGTRDGGAAEAAGTALMVAALVGLAPIALALAAGIAAWVVLTALMPIASIRRFVRVRRASGEFWERARVEVRRVLTDVGVDADAAIERRPHEFSGGQAQRIAIARALIVNPDVLICDEPVAALDVSVQAQVLNLLEQLKERYGLSLVFIAHDMAVVKNISDRVVVMYLGKVCEVAEPGQLFAAPAHPYTRLLMSAIPVADPAVDPRRTARPAGDLPSPLRPPSGCRFRTRCPRATDRCAREEPHIEQIAAGQFVACHHPITAPSESLNLTSGHLAD